MSDDSYRHPGGRTCGVMAGMFVMVASLLAALFRKASR